MDRTSFLIRSVDTESRTIEGIAAPYGQTVNVGDYNERFEPGAFGDIQDVRLYSEHDHIDGRAPIGMVLDGKDTADGFVIRARISDTAKGNEVYQLVQDGVLKNFSVGFAPVEDRVEDDNTIVRTKVDLKEVSVVAFPAYSAATILAVRNGSNRAHSATTTNERSHNTEKIMTDINIDYATVADLDEIRTEFDRRVSAIADADPVDAAPQFRTAGEFVKAHAEGDDNATALYRAYTGATTAKSHTGLGWIDSTLAVINKGRKTVELFTKESLPASGNIVTYPYISATTGAVASQANEGDDLTQLDITIATASAAIKTFGVKSDLSLQVIQRSDVPYLDRVLQAQAASYAKVTNDYVRSIMVAATPQTGTSFTLASATAKDFITAVVDGVSKIDANGNGLQADFVVMSPDVALAAATVLDTNGNQIFANGIAGLPVKIDSGLAAKTLYVASAGAVVTWENAGAPVRLDAENVVNLSHVYSIYGFLSAAVVNSLGMVKATIS